MERRALGRNTISAIGLGCAGMSEGYGSHDDELSLQTLHAALDQGVDFVDTSDAYGMGHNEQLLGKFLQGRRDQITVATKFGLVRKPGTPAPYIDNSPRYARDACDASLRRLGIDTIDLYYAHRRNPAVPIEELVGAMAGLVTAGKVRYLGLSEVSGSTLRRAHAVHPIAAIQSEYSLWSRDPEADVLDTCRALDIAFVAYAPLGRAFLTGTIVTLDNLEATDFRRRLPRFQGEALEKNLRLVHELQTFANQLEVTPAQVALAWLLAKNTHIVPIPGTKQPRYAIENAAAAHIKLTQEQTRRLDALFPLSAAAGERYPAPAMAGIEASSHSPDRLSTANR